MVAEARMRSDIWGAKNGCTRNEKKEIAADQTGRTGSLMEMKKSKHRDNKLTDIKQSAIGRDRMSGERNEYREGKKKKIRDESSHKGKVRWHELKERKV